MGGRIYRVARGQRDVLEGLLRCESLNPSSHRATYPDKRKKETISEFWLVGAANRRYDKWWNDPKGRNTFTLSIVDEAPVVSDFKFRPKHTLKTRLLIFALIHQPEMVMLMALVLEHSYVCDKK
jgi:hypothetical protein